MSGDKLYAQEENGIRVISGRRIGEVRIANYVYDLWLPLIGAEALTVYGIYCRLERRKLVKAMTMKDIARCARIGDKTLEDINQKLQRCGFVILRKPKGEARGKHYTSEVVTLTPPRRIPQNLIELYQIKSGYVPLTQWLVESLGEALDGASTHAPSSASPSAIQRVHEALNGASIIVATLCLQPLYIATKEFAQAAFQEEKMDAPQHGASTTDPLMQHELRAALDDFDQAVVEERSADLSASQEIPPVVPVKSKRPSKQTVPAAQMNPMKDHIEQLFDPLRQGRKPTKSEWGQICAAASELCLSGYTPQDAERIYRYCQDHYDHFTPSALPKHAREAIRPQATAMIGRLKIIQGTTALEAYGE